MCVWRVCVRERERERVCVCERVRECVRAITHVLHRLLCSQSFLLVKLVSGSLEVHVGVAEGGAVHKPS